MSKEKAKEIRRLLSTAHMFCRETNFCFRGRLWKELLRVIHTCSYDSDRIYSEYLAGYETPAKLTNDYAGTKEKLSVLYKEAFGLVSDAETFEAFRDKAENSLFVIRNLVQKQGSLSTDSVFMCRQINNEMEKDCDRKALTHITSRMELKALKGGFFETLKYVCLVHNDRQAWNIRDRMESGRMRFDSLEQFDEYRDEFTPYFQKEIAKEIRAYERRKAYYRKAGYTIT